MSGDKPIEKTSNRLIEPYQKQLIEKEFSNLFASLENKGKDELIYEIFELKNKGYTNEDIYGLLKGVNFPLKNCIAVAGGKGGVGKTTIAVNIAYYYARVGRKVLLFDADYGLSNAHIYLNFRTQKTLLDYFLSANPYDAVETIFPNLDYIHTGSGELKLSDLDEHEFSKIRKMMLELSEKYDIIVIDCSPGIGKDVLQTLYMCALCLVVSTPHISSITDTYALIKVMSMAKILPKLSLCVNMARSTFEAKEAYDRIALCAKKFLGINVAYAGMVFYSSKINLSINNKVPVVKTSAYDRRSGGKIVEIAKKTIDDLGLNFG